MTSILTSSLSESEIRQMERRIQEAREDRSRFAEKVFYLICSYYGADPERVTNHSRDRELVLTRQVFHYFISKYTDMPLKRIGNLTNNDHSTVIYSRQKVLDMLRFETTLRYDLGVLDKHIKDILANG